MKNRYVRLLLGLLLLTSVLSGCEKLKNVEKIATRPAPVVVQNGETAEDSVQDGEELAYASDSIVIETEPERVPVKVKGIYVSAYVAGTPSMVDNLIAELDRTEINTLVIDLKDDFGRIVCEMDCAPVQEIGAVKIYIQDMEMLMEKLREHHIYTIARIPAFRDSWLGEARPDWCVKKADGSLFKDRDGNVWVNPYKREAWDYLVEIGVQAKKLGFQEVQFDYVRFCTEKGMKDAVFDEADVQGRSRTDIILEFMEYTYGKLKDEGLFVSADVFGAIINSGVDADSVGQIYGELAKHVDYISLMTRSGRLWRNPAWSCILQVWMEDISPQCVHGCRILRLPGWQIIFPMGDRRFVRRFRRSMTAVMMSGFCGMRRAPMTGAVL